MSIYSRLLRLYRTNMMKTPLEDFTTEILAGILSIYPDIGNAFAQSILKLEGEHFSFETQEHYKSPDPQHPDCRVDLIVRSEGMICFIESKVESREGYIQLERYARVLDELCIDKKTHLKYCTKYYDAKLVTDHNFHQFRWADVYRFLSEWSSSEVIQHFLDFLNEHDMSDNMDFNLGDLTTMQALNPTVKKMERYLEKIRQVFGHHFSAARIKDSINLKQIKIFSRFIFHADDIFGENGYSELGVGFDFGEIPMLKVWIWVNDKNAKAGMFKAALAKTDMQNNGENWLGRTKPLTDFMSSDKMEQEIEVWFATSFEQIKGFQSVHQDLNWHI